MVISLERGADLHMAQLTVSCFRKIQIDFTFMVLAHPGNPEQRAVKKCVKLIVKNAKKYSHSLNAMRRQFTDTDTIHI